MSGTLMTDALSYNLAIVSWLAAAVTITTGNSLLLHNGVLPASHTYLHALWVATVAIQAVFLFSFYEPASKAVKQHFVLNNLLLFAWQVLLKYKLDAIALVAAMLLLVSAAGAYARERTYNISPARDWFIVHFSVTAIPLIVGLYLTIAQAWNVLDIPKTILGIRATNAILIVHFVLVGGLLVRFGDWGTGLLGAGLATAIGVNAKKHATGYFGEVTGLILLIGSIYFAYNRPKRGIHLGNNDEAPLLG